MQIEMTVISRHILETRDTGPRAVGLRFVWGFPKKSLSVGAQRVVIEEGKCEKVLTFLLFQTT